MSLERALQVAAEAGNRAQPKPTIGAVVVRNGEVVGEGATELGGRHAEVVALDAAGAKARRSTLYVTMEPCAHWGTTPPCADRIIAEGVSRVVYGSVDPNPEAAGGAGKLRQAGIEVEFVDSAEARRQTEAWRMWVTQRRPFVTYKTAVTLDGRMAVPGERWISSEPSRVRVHELRVLADAVAVGMGTVRADDPRLDVRLVRNPARQPRRLAFGKGPLPEGSGLELRSGALADELAALAGEGVQSLLLESGPTLAQAFFDAALIDKLILFVAPRVAAGEGPVFAPRLASSQQLGRFRVETVGEDVLLEAYVHEP